MPRPDVSRWEGWRPAKPTADLVWWLSELTTQFPLQGGRRRRRKRYARLGPRRTEGGGSSGTRQPRRGGLGAAAAANGGWWRWLWRQGRWRCRVHTSTCSRRGKSSRVPARWPSTLTCIGLHSTYYLRYGVSSSSQSGKSTLLGVPVAAGCRRQLSVAVVNSGHTWEGARYEGDTR